MIFLGKFFEPAHLFFTLSHRQTLPHTGLAGNRHNQPNEVKNDNRSDQYKTNHPPERSIREAGIVQGNNLDICPNTGRFPETNQTWG